MPGDVPGDDGRRGRGQRRLDELGLRPLTARSVMLSTLLGTHPPQLPVRALVRVGQLFEIPEGTVRVALSRMAADGEITADNGTYRLGPRLRERASRQDESRAPGTRPWDGRWVMAVVTATRRTAAERSALRREMLSLRLAEQREGVWLRPANLRPARPRPVGLERQCSWFHARPDGDPAELARELWDLDAWVDRARRLHDALDAVDALDPASSLAEGFMVSAAVLRHLLSDPLLPDELVPGGWPGAELRERYAPFDAAFRARLLDYTRASAGKA